MALNWEKNEFGTHKAPGFVIEETGNPAEPYALFTTDRHTNRATQYATMTGSLEQCQHAAEVMAGDKENLDATGLPETEPRGQVRGGKPAPE